MSKAAKIAIVTGGSRGLGRSTVLGLAERGVHSIFTYHSNQKEADNVVNLVSKNRMRGRCPQARYGQSCRVRCFREGRASGAQQVERRQI